MSDKDKSGSFYTRLAQAATNQKEEEPVVDSSSDEMVQEEQDDYAAQAAPDPESLAEIKRAAALSDAKFSKLKRKLLKGQVRRQKQNNKMRKIYASKAYKFVWLWSIFFFLILLLSGYKNLTIEALDFKLISKFELNDPVLIALITGVTVNIVAVFIIVMRNLFPSSEKEDKEADKTVEKAERK
ncbi:hypothetical protein [Lelliottia nimipressuralis]|uniref:DUF1049 domain-containing protein n=1 Tax=Lelliottia nimipressuralis TaxID=69220 RepID=A0ABD4KB14_9ENTR|nr:hypothetical protein [Lelliottia nimipressuralis]MBF4179132.1 hypothetical protein [Lelliottia nimipressuralis]